MTDRRVRVTVDADYDPLIKGSGEAVVATKAVQEEMGKLDRQVDETSAEMGKLATTTAVAKREVSDLGDKAKASGRDLAALDRRIDSTRRAVGRLGIEFGLTGDAIAGKKLAGQQSMLAQLEQLRAELKKTENSGIPVLDLLTQLGKAGGVPALGGAAKAAIGGPTSAAEGVASTPILGPAALVAAVPAVFALAAPIGAMIAGAVTGVIGGGGIAGGIFAASKDPVVRSAAHQFGADISREFFGSGAAFIDPIRQSLSILDDDFGKLHLDKAFAKLAPDVEKLAKGVGDFALRAMPGLERAFDRAGPFIDVLAKGLGDTGGALGYFVDAASKSHGAIEGLQALFGTLTSGIKVAGIVLEGTSEALHEFDEMLATAIKIAAYTADALGLPSDKLKQLANQMQQFADGSPKEAVTTTKLLGDAFAGAAYQADALAQAIKDAQQAQTDFIGLHLALDQALTAVSAGYKDLTDAVKQNGRHWNDNTREADANHEAVNRQIDNLGRVRDAEIAAGMSIAQADAEYNKGVAKVMAYAAALGATKAQLDALQGVYTIDINVIRREISVAVMANKTDKDLRFAGFASGGETPAYAPFKVGEHGTEYLFADKQHFVATKQQMAMPWRGGAGPSSAPAELTLRVIHQTPDGRVLRTELIRDALGRGTPSVTTAAAYP